MMLASEKNIEELRSALQHPRPILIAQGVHPQYLEALCLELIAQDELCVEVHTVASGVARLTHEGRMAPFVSGSSLSDLLESLALKRQEISPMPRRPPAQTLIWVQAPAEALNTIELCATLSDLAQQIARCRYPWHILLATSSSLTRQDLDPWINPLELSSPRDQALERYIDEVLQVADIKLLQSESQTQLLNALRGLPADAIFEIIAQAQPITDHSNAQQELRWLKEVKSGRDTRLRSQRGVEIIEVRERADDMGGMNYLKRYLGYDAAIFHATQEQRTQQQLDMPRGILLVGLPGCGKSLASRVAASILKIPLLRLDIGSLMGKYLGESEERLQDALASIEASAPCVVWIDEIEKALGGMTGSEGSSGTGRRMFGRLLTWMQEHTTGVYIMATANAVDELPAELLRRGRFDELFFVDLPTSDERGEILRIHLNKRGLRINEETRQKIVSDRHMKDFSGADIEAIIKEAHRRMFVLGNLHHTTQNQDVDHSEVFFETIIQIAKTFQPFAKQWEGKIEELRKSLTQQGFRPVSVDEPSLDAQLPSPPEHAQQLPPTLAALLTTKLPIVLHTLQSPGSDLELTIELDPLVGRGAARLALDALTRVSPNNAQLTGTLRPDGASLLLELPPEERGQIKALGHIQAVELKAKEQDTLELIITSLGAIRSWELGVEHIYPEKERDLPPLLWQFLHGACETLYLHDETGECKVTFHGEGEGRVALFEDGNGVRQELKIKVYEQSLQLYNTNKTSFRVTQANKKIKTTKILHKNPTPDPQAKINIKIIKNNTIETHHHITSNKPIFFDKTTKTYVPEEMRTNRILHIDNQIAYIRSIKIQQEENNIYTFSIDVELDLEDSLKTIEKIKITTKKQDQSNRYNITQINIDYFDRSILKIDPPLKSNFISSLFNPTLQKDSTCDSAYKLIGDDNYIILTEI